MLEKYCDILVIGTKLPGLITAAFLARRGLAVQVLHSDFYEDHPHLPDPVCLTGGHSKMLRSLLGRLNVPENVIQNFLHHNSNLQVIFPRHRIDVFANPLEYAEEIDREFPDYRDQIRSFYENLAKLRHQIDINDLFQQIPPTRWSERRQFKKYVAANGLNSRSDGFDELMGGDPTLKAYFRSQYLLATQHVCDHPLSFQVAELFNPGDGEVFSTYAGMHGLTNMLLERITHFDGKVRRKTAHQKLLYRNGIMEGVELANSQDSILAKYVIWNSSMSSLQKMLPRKCRFYGLRKKCLDPEYLYSWFTVRYKVPSTHIPEMMKSNCAVIADPERELSGTNFLYLQISDPDSEGLRILNINFLLPRENLSQDFGFFENCFVEIEARLSEILPFSEKVMKRIFPLRPVEHQGDESQATLFPLHENDFEVFRHAAEIHGVSELKIKNFTDFFAVPCNTPSPNFFISNPAVFDGMGFESKLTLGLKITDLIWQEVDKEKKRAMKSERRIA